MPDDAWADRLRRSIDACKVGAVTTCCCHLDLYPIDTEEEAAELKAELEAVLRLEGTDLGYVVWATREAALDDLGHHATGDEAREIAAMRSDPDLWGSMAIADRMRDETRGAS